MTGLSFVYQTVGIRWIRDCERHPDQLEVGSWESTKENGTKDTICKTHARRPLYSKGFVLEMLDNVGHFISGSGKTYGHKMHATSGDQHWHLVTRRQKNTRRQFQSDCADSSIKVEKQQTMKNAAKAHSSVNI